MVTINVNYNKCYSLVVSTWEVARGGLGFQGTAGLRGLVGSSLSAAIAGGGGAVGIKLCILESSRSAKSGRCGYS